MNGWVLHFQLTCLVEKPISQPVMLNVIEWLKNVALTRATKVQWFNVIKKFILNVLPVNLAIFV